MGGGLLVWLFGSKRVFFASALFVCVCVWVWRIFIYKSHYYFMFVECLSTLKQNDSLWKGGVWLWRDIECGVEVGSGK